MDGGIEKYNEHTFSVGGQLSKKQGKLLHYNAIAEIGIAGEDAGTLAVDGNLDVNIPFLGDTLSIIGDAFFHRENPSFTIESIILDTSGGKTISTRSFIPASWEH